MFIITGKVLSKLYHDEIICSSVHSYTRRSSTPDDSGDVLKLIELLAPRKKEDPSKVLSPFRQSFLSLIPRV